MSEQEDGYTIVELFTQAVAVRGDQEKALEIVANAVGFEGLPEKLPRLVVLPVSQEIPGALELIRRHPLYGTDDVLKFRLARDGYEPDLPPAS